MFERFPPISSSFQVPSSSMMIALGFRVLLYVCIGVVLRTHRITTPLELAMSWLFPQMLSAGMMIGCCVFVNSIPIS